MGLEMFYGTPCLCIWIQDEGTILGADGLDDRPETRCLGLEFRVLRELKLEARPTARSSRRTS